jgi:hypothetical protein
VKEAFFTAVKGFFIPLQPGVSGLGPECPGNLEFPAPSPDTPLPLNPASRFSRNLVFVEIWKVSYVINVSLSSINTLD